MTNKGTLAAFLALAAALPVFAQSDRPPGPKALAALSALEHLPKKSDSGPYIWNTGQYSYDGSGNITNIGSQSYVYDSVNRLTQSVTVTAAGSNPESYTYDSYGNQISRNTVGVPRTIGVDPATNHLTGSVTAYDVAGNLVAWQPSGSAYTYQYTFDALDTMQRESVTSLGSYVFYAYTADDERLLRYDGPTNESHWIIRDLNHQELRDFKLSGVTWSVFRDDIYRGSTLLAATAAATATVPANVEHMSIDHLGTPRLITDRDHKYLAFHAYYPFGIEAGASEDNEPRKFTSHERDGDTAGSNNTLDYMHARYDDAASGRFLSVDPALDLKMTMTNPQAWNRYSYVRNNPMRWTDPTGKVIAYDDDFRKRVKTDETFRKAFEAWKQTKSGAAQWKAMGRDTNTVYKFSVGRIDAPTGLIRTEQANGRTLPIVFGQNENKSGKLDQPNVNMMINADFVESRYRNVPSMTVPAMARALFEEASHGLDIGSGTKSAKEAWDAEPMFNTGTEPRMQQFERELKDILPPPDGN
jgi:RHS repeat-associated protein